MNISYKKTLQQPKADEDERRIFQETIKAYKAQNRVIVYIDESGFARDMSRTHGYAPIGRRYHDVVTGTLEAALMQSAHQSIFVPSVYTLFS